MKNNIICPKSILTESKDKVTFDLPEDIVKSIFRSCCEYDPLQVIFDLPMVCKEWHEWRLLKREVMAAGKQFSLFLARYSDSLTSYDLGPFKEMILEGIRQVLTSPDLIEQIPPLSHGQLVRKIYDNFQHLHFDCRFTGYSELIKACRGVYKHGSIPIPDCWNSVDILTGLVRNLADNLDSIDPHVCFKMSAEIVNCLFFKVLVEPKFTRTEITRLRPILLYIMLDKFRDTLFLILTSNEEESLDYPRDQVIAFIEYLLNGYGLYYLVPFYTQVYDICSNESIVGCSNKDIIPFALAKMIETGQHEHNDSRPFLENVHTMVSFLTIHPIMEEADMQPLIRFLSNIASIDDEWIERNIFEKNVCLLSDLIARKLLQ